MGVRAVIYDGNAYLGGAPMQVRGVECSLDGES